MSPILLLIIPFVFLVIVLLSPAVMSRTIAFAGSIIELGWVIRNYVTYETDPAKLTYQINWVKSMGIEFSLGIDGISLILILLTGLLYPFIIAASKKEDLKNPRAFYPLMLLMQLGLMGVFMARDAFLFYTFYEISLIPIYFICAIWGGERSVPITLKFFIYTITGSLFMLVAIIYLYFKTPGSHTFNIEAFYRLQLSISEQSWIFWAFFLAFAVKIPLFPFHTWQPDTYTVSPTAGTMLLAGIMLKMGIYGMIRFIVPVVPLGLAEWENTALALCTIGIVYASLIALRQQDLKRLLAYSSMAHVGLIAAGVLSVNTSGLQGAIIQMFNHGVNVVALFIMIDIIENRYGTRWMDQLGGVAGQMKKLGVFFIIILLGSVGLPLTNGFIGEFLLLMGIYQHSHWAAAFAGLTLILGAAYMLRLYRNVFLGDIRDDKFIIRDSTTRENLIIIPLCLLVLLVGIYPAPLLDISATSVQQLLQYFNSHNSVVSNL